MKRCGGRNSIAPLRARDEFPEFEYNCIMTVENRLRQIERILVPKQFNLAGLGNTWQRRGAHRPW